MIFCDFLQVAKNEFALFGVTCIILVHSFSLLSKRVPSNHLSIIKLIHVHMCNRTESLSVYHLCSFYYFNSCYMNVYMSCMYMYMNVCMNDVCVHTHMT